MNDIAEKMRMLRLGHGILEKDIAERLSMSRPAYSNSERGVTKMDIERFKLVARFYNLKPEELWSLNANELLRLSLHRTRGGGGGATLMLNNSLKAA